MKRASFFTGSFDTPSTETPSFRYAKHGNAQLVEFVLQRGKILRLIGAAGGIRLGIEIEHQRPFRIAFKREGLPIHTFQRGVWNPLAFTHHLQLPHIVQQWTSEEHTSELQSLMRISYAVFCLK